MRCIKRESVQSQLKKGFSTFLTQNKQNKPFFKRYNHFKDDEYVSYKTVTVGNLLPEDIWQRFYMQTDAKIKEKPE